jgi:hypothetical protein
MALPEQDDERLLCTESARTFLKRITETTSALHKEFLDCPQFKDERGTPCPDKLSQS